jgi:hypothetical protein
VGVLLICLLVFIAFCIVFTLFLYCFVYVYLLFFVLSVLGEGLLSLNDISVAVSNNSNDIRTDSELFLLSSDCNIHFPCSVPCVFLKILKINSSYFPKQH